MFRSVQTLPYLHFVLLQALVLLFAVSLLDKMVSFEMNDLKKIGLGLTGFGIFFSFLGIIFVFDKGLIAMGNILFLSGLGLTIGLKSTMQFFTKPKNYKGTISFGAGFFLVLIGWPFFGMLLEAYGFIVLFSGFWPTLAVFLQRIPIIGWFFQQPFVTSFLDRYRGKRVPV
ncbi:vesicle transport protein GOT1-like isoform X1 [Phragmites australis]|uniref:vesicle transport protein GOT1-like isoform X1 n=2 Tax=Phragmites australis TaxID=29695 RepID=UPI002D799295|nr:vesicle transport protein GOT1-like isoform X1 [Phragmites australis]